MDVYYMPRCQRYKKKKNTTHITTSNSEWYIAVSFGRTVKWTFNVLFCTASQTFKIRMGEMFRFQQMNRQKIVHEIYIPRHTGS